MLSADWIVSPTSPRLSRDQESLMESFEDRRAKDEITEKLPLRGRRKTCSIRVVLYYDPEYVPVARV
eukprot:8771667-Pyramimonas_sp.AAC.1